MVPIVSVDTSELYCGISVTEPSIEASVTVPITISGYISGCGWEPYREYVATLKIFDGENKLIGRPYLINKDPNNQSPVSVQFSFTVRDLPMKEGDIRLVFENFGVLEKEFVLPLHLRLTTGDVSR